MGAVLVVEVGYGDCGEGSLLDSGDIGQEREKGRECTAKGLLLVVESFGLSGSGKDGGGEGGDLEVEVVFAGVELQGAGGCERGDAQERGEGLGEMHVFV